MKKRAKTTGEKRRTKPQPRRPSNGLAALAGKWNRHEFENFEAAVAEMCERVDVEATR